jgi:hypothetical protein
MYTEPTKYAVAVEGEEVTLTVLARVTVPRTLWADQEAVIRWMAQEGIAPEDIKDVG